MPRHESERARQRFQTQWLSVLAPYYHTADQGRPIDLGTIISSIRRFIAASDSFSCNIHGFMDHPVTDALLHPALSRIPALNSHLPNLAFSDAEFVLLGVRRILTLNPSGRAFLQSVRQCEVTDVSLRAYFGAASSSRRMTMLHELNASLSLSICGEVDRFACFPELSGRDILAIDGHDIRRASHEPKDLLSSGRLEVPDTVTGVFLRNLRTGAARVLGQTSGHQNEWSAAKAQPWSEFTWRPEARGTILVIDPIAVDFAFLRAAKIKASASVITRMKSNLVVTKSRKLNWDVTDNRNDGVIEDERVHFNTAGEFRRVTYKDPESREIYEFLTTEFHLPPGLIAQLYRLRWDIEKFFDVCETLLNEKKAWGTGPIPAQVQSEFLVMTHNLILLISRRLKREEGITDEKVVEKYRAALKARQEQAALRGGKVSPWVEPLRQITRWSSQFVRWLSDAVVHAWSWPAGVVKLRPLMRAYMR
jgi:hypothetical protein